jgi:hypothetical protein
MLLEELFNNLHGTLLLFVSLLAIVQKQGEHNTCFLNTMEGKRSKQAVVQLKLNANKILELLQWGRGCLVHLLWNYN